MAAAVSAVSGFIDVGINAISSVVSDFGDIFITAGSGLTDFAAVSPLEFGVGLDDLASFGAYEQVGSLAGNSTWFNAFNAGDIIDDVGSVFDGSGFFPASASDFGGIGNFVASAGDVFDTGGFIPISPSDFGGFGDFVSSAGSVFDTGGFIPVSPSDFGAVISSAGGVADSGFLSSFKLPSLSDIKSVASQVQTDFGGFVRDLQVANREFQRIAPLVNVASSALGIQNPLSEIAQPLNLVAGVAGAAAGVAGTVSRVGNALPTSTPGSVVASAGGFGNFRELSVAESLELERRNISPILINRLTDPGISGTVTNAVTNIVNSPTNVASTAASQFLSFYEPESATWSVFDTTTNTTVQSGLSEQQAISAERDLNISAAGVTLNSSTTADLGDQGEIVVTATRLPAEATTEENAVTAGFAAAARNQETLRQQRNTKAQSSDWRVKLSLAPNSNYLYNTPDNPGILLPLRNTGGIIFPYTPTIETAYKANYDTYDLTHSNYRGYFYKNSYVDAVNLRATFTAQDTNEANYLLAVIHFFRSVTKMFYGQKTDQRGAPPPLVFIKGYGDFQFNNHPCLVSQFNYTLPPDVDYIRAQSILNNNTNLQLARLRNTIANNPLAYTARRVLNSGLLPGALDLRPPIANNISIGNPTYVPTKMEISISLLPIQSRQQISKNFSIGGFADGNLLNQGFW